MCVLLQKAENEIARLLKQRQKLYRCEPGSPQIDELTGKLKELRRTVGLCRNIETHSIEIERRLQADRHELQKQEELKQAKNDRSHDMKR